jgi:hypothetical protein
VEKAINALYFETAGTENMSSFSGTWPGELAVALEDAVNAGAPNVEIMVIAHQTGNALLDYIHPTGTGLAQRYDDLELAYDVLKTRELDVVIPVGAYMDDQLPDTTENFGKQLADFCFQATTENNSCVGVMPTRPVLRWAFANRTGIATAAGADSTLSGELVDLFVTVGVDEAVAFGALETGMANMFFGSASSALVGEWVAYHTRPQRSANFLSDVYDAGFYNAAYLAWLSGAADQDGNILDEVDADAATSVNTAYFATWQADDSDGNPAVDSRNVKIDAGQYLSVFSAPLRAVNTQVRSVALALGAAPSNTSMNVDGSASYAGLINSLAPQSSTTNKAVSGVVQLKLLSYGQANDLTGMRHVTMFSRTTGLTVASGVTGAHNVSAYVRSDYVRLSTLRITIAAVDLIRAVGSKFIGEPNNAPQMNAMDAEIDQVLLSMKGQGALNSYSFSITSTPDQRVLGQLDINLTLVPAFEITEINLVVSLSSEL